MARRNNKNKRYSPEWKIVPDKLEIVEVGGAVVVVVVAEHFQLLHRAVLALGALNRGILPIFTIYEKETKNEKYRSDPFQACNFAIDREGRMVCPNGKRFFFLKTVPVRGNQFGRTEEYYQCEDRSGCPYREKCHKSKDNRIVRINEELTRFHNEVLDDLNCVHGALLRMNRSIQSEGAFGGIKWNRQYQRIRRRGIEGVILELGLICCGYNLHKFHLKQMAAQKAA